MKTMKTQVIYLCQKCDTPFVAEQGSRRRYCDKCLIERLASRRKYLPPEGKSEDLGLGGKRR